MRSLLLLATAVVACTTSRQPAEHGLRYLTIGHDAVATAREIATGDGARLELVADDTDIAVIAIDAEELDALSEVLHERFHRCGGFVVHDTEQAALAAQAEVRIGAGAATMLDYTLDRAKVVRAVLPAIDQARIRDTIAELAAFKNRYYQSASGARASLWLRDKWRSLTTRADVTVELVDHGWEQKSVIMTIPGTTRAREVVVLGGHLDSIALGGLASTAPGADDDASGIATLTEVARVLLASDYRPARTIQVMAYAAEEVGLRGSQAIATDYKRRKIDVVGALQLDMTNYQGSDKDIWLMKDFTNPAQNGFVIQLIEAYVGATWGQDACGYGCSDHASWYRAGVPASMPFESRMRERNREIHTARDTLELSDNNAAHAVKFARLAAAYAIELGKGELGTAPVRPPSRNRSTVLALLLALGAAGSWCLRRATP